MKLLVFGGRDYRDEAAAYAALDRANARREITIIIEGGCRSRGREQIGADYFAHKWAMERGVTCITEPARWSREGRAAGPLRNQRMIDTWEPDGAIGFPGGKGTEDMARRVTIEGIQLWRPYA